MCAFAGVCAAVSVVWAVSSVKASPPSEPITVHEANQFLDHMDRALSHRNQDVGLTFLRYYVADSARFEFTLLEHAPVPPMRADVYRAGLPMAQWSMHNTGRVYHSRTGGVLPVRVLNSQYGDKHQLMMGYYQQRLQTPGYAQQTVLEGMTLHKGAHGAVLDVRFTAHAAVGRLSSRAQCQLHLRKTGGRVYMSARSCEAVRPRL